MARRGELYRNPQLSLAAILAIVAFAAWMFAWLVDIGNGSRVPLAVMYVVVGFLIIVNAFGIKRILGVRLPTLSFLEWLTIWFICLIAHGLTLPAVESSPHRRGFPPAAVPRAVPLKVMGPKRSTGDVQGGNPLKPAAGESAIPRGAGVVSCSE